MGKGTAWIKLLPGALRVIAPVPDSSVGAEAPMEKSSKKMHKQAAIVTD